MLAIDTAVIDSLFKFLCEGDVKGTDEEVFAAWINQASEIPDADNLPMCFQMIRNMKKVELNKTLLKKCCKMIY